MAKLLSVPMVFVGGFEIVNLIVEVQVVDMQLVWVYSYNRT